MSKVALITGVTGRDGAYLACLPLEKSYTVRGAKRRSSFETLEHTAYADHRARREAGLVQAA